MDRPKRIHLQSVSEYSDRFIQNVATDSRVILPMKVLSGCCSTCNSSGVSRLDALDSESVTASQDGDGIPFLRFSGAAQLLFDDWRGTLERRLRCDDLHPAFESHLAKYRSLVPSLTLLIHLAEGGRGSVAVSYRRIPIFPIKCGDGAVHGIPGHQKWVTSVRNDIKSSKDTLSDGIIESTGRRCGR